MDIFSLRWFIIGVLISIPFHWFLLSARTQISNARFENKLAVNTIVQMLGLVLIIAGFAFSIYGNYLTARAGEGNMTPDDFTKLANQFFYYFQWYVFIIWAIIGIAVGTGFILMIRSIWRYIKPKQNNKQQTEDDFSITISIKEMDSILKKRRDYSKVKSKVDDFLKQMSDGDTKESDDSKTQNKESKK